MTKTSTKKAFQMNGWTYEYNEALTSNWCWPNGYKGQRIRIKKHAMLQLIKERDAFKMAYTQL